MKTKAILFDRDGTLGELADKRYPQTLSPYCDIREAFLKIKEKGYFVGILSNQSSVARGTGAGYDFDGEFSRYGADIWKICPHDNADGCDCRKPKSGMLLSAAAALGIPLEECMIVGDRLSDIQCAKNVGARAVLVLTGYGKEEREQVLSLYPETPVLPRFDEILKLL
ncbi:MAG: HAD-IIIA family hydrolase [Clostridia bacterium]|nr:HAD-IIIA family hydrolase [Clostridia bacterium]